MSPSELDAADLGPGGEGEKNYTELVLTGGPCAGKSTALAHLREAEDHLGVTVLTAPEVATMIHDAGFPIDPTDRVSFMAFQAELVRAQGALRRSYQKLAEALAPQRVLIVYDRAEIDTAAYVSTADHAEILAEQGLERAELRDSYDAVFHMTTAALGAESAYTTENNAARRESVQEARDADQRTLRAWLGHSHLKIISNAGEFSEKLRRLLGEATALLGAGGPVETERKWLIDPPPPEEILRELAHRSEITQIYLESAGADVERRIRERADSYGSVTRTVTEKRSLPCGDPTAPLKRIETERLISKREFQTLAEGEEARLVKIRWVFAHNGQVFELDQFETAGSGPPLWLLEAELGSDESRELELPEWLSVVREVTSEPEFRSAAIASRLAAH